jgi:hypothetical protein
MVVDTEKNTKMAHTKICRRKSFGSDVAPLLFCFHIDTVVTGTIDDCEANRQINETVRETPLH